MCHCRLPERLAVADHGLYSFSLFLEVAPALKREIGLTLPLAAATGFISILHAVCEGADSALSALIDRVVSAGGAASCAVHCGYRFSLSFCGVRNDGARRQCCARSVRYCGRDPVQRCSRTGRSTARVQHGDWAWWMKPAHGNTRRAKSEENENSM